MKTKEEILNDYNCPEIPFHENVTMYYPSILKAMQEYADQQTEQLKAEVDRLKNEIKGLEMLYKQACDAAGSYEKRAREAEKEIRNILNNIER